jgi:hypothetical protein
LPADGRYRAKLAGCSACALAALGEDESARTRRLHALRIGPGNFDMRYNIACTLHACLADKAGALATLETVFDAIAGCFLRTRRRTRTSSFFENGRATRRW